MPHGLKVLKFDPEEHGGSDGESEANLVRQIQGGDGRAFDELVRRYQARLYALAFRMVRDPADAEDICQEALIKAHDAIRGFREDASVYTWLYRITINQCVNLLRRKKIWKLIPLDPLSRWLGADQVGPEREAARNDVAMAVERAVSRLPNRQKTVFLLRQYEGFTHEEIAGILGRSVGAVKSSYFHAVQRLQKDLVEYRRYYREGLL